MAPYKLDTTCLVAITCSVVIVAVCAVILTIHFT